MINYHITLVENLNKVLPTHFEMNLTSKTKTPCISYMELDNSVSSSGDTIGYSRISYQIKVWGNKLEDLQEYAQQIDNTLRPLGWKRIGCGEMYDNKSTMIQKIMTYEALALEAF